MDLKVEDKLTMVGTQNEVIENSQPDASHHSVGKTSSPHSEALVSGRLERELETLESIGFKSHVWKANPDTASSIATLTLDVNWLIAQRELPYLVQTLPTHLLYRSIMEHGVEDSLEVVEWIRGGALLRTLDYDLWTGEQGQTGLMTGDEQPSGERFLQWIKWWNEISPDFATQRVLELDEGLIVGCMTAVCEIVPIGLNRQQEELSDDYWITPDNRFGLKMTNGDESGFEIFHQFIQSLYRNDIRIAQSLLAHSAMLVKEESIEEARRWRKGRLEDQGFLTADEARQLLAPKTHKQLTDMVRIAVETEPKRSPVLTQNVDSEMSETSNSLQDPELHENLVEFMRTRDSEELASEIEQTLSTSEIIRLVGTSAPQSDVLLQDEDVMDAFVGTIAKRTRNVLLAMEVQRGRLLRNNVFNSKATLLVDEVIACLSETSIERVMDYKSRIARTTNAVAASFGVANQTAELDRVLTTVRGCLNIGLQRLLKDADVFFAGSAAVRQELSENALTVPQAAAVLSAVGPEAIFQVGWQTLQELASDALQMLVYMAGKDEPMKSKISPDYDVRLSDGQTVKIPVLQLLARGRYLEVRKWLRKLEAFFEPGVQHILNSTLNRLPVFPIILNEENALARGTTQVKPYETLNEVEISAVFIGRLLHMVNVTAQGD